MDDRTIESRQVYPACYVLHTTTVAIMGIPTAAGAIYFPKVHSERLDKYLKHHSKLLLTAPLIPVVPSHHLQQQVTKVVPPGLRVWKISQAPWSAPTKKRMPGFVMEWLKVPSGNPAPRI